MVAVAILEFHAIECAQGFISSILLVLFQQEVAVVDLAGYLPRGYVARHHDVVNAFRMNDDTTISRQEAGNLLREMQVTDIAFAASARLFCTEEETERLLHEITF